MFYLTRITGRASITLMRRGPRRPEERGISLGIPSVVILAGWLCAYPALPQTWDREAAESALIRARELKEQLAIDPAGSSRESYLECIRFYRRVYFSDPHFHGSDDAIYESAVLYQEMGTKFSSADYVRAAVKLFKFLVKDYDTSPYRSDALRRLGALEPTQDQAAQSVADAQTTLPLQATSAASKSNDAPLPDRAGATLHAKRTATVRSIRHWSASEYTRMVIDLDGRVPYQKGLLGNPDRLFFDLSNTMLDGKLSGSPIAVGDRFLKQIRMGQNRPNVVRVVLELEKGIDYSVSELSDPFRLVVDIRKAGNPGANLATSSASGDPATESVSPPLPLSAPAPDRLKDLAAAKPAVRKSPPAPTPSEVAPSRQTVTPLPTAVRVNGTKEVAEGNRPSATSSRPTNAAIPRAGVQSPSNGSVKTQNLQDYLASAPRVTLDLEEMRKAGLPKVVFEAKDASTPASPKSSEARNTVDTQPPPKPSDLPPPAKMASPTSAGSMTLTRVLGLKVTRIVIDPGHGGSDTGTVGRTGLMEKDLVLDVARELKKALEERIGALVVMTREDDRFVSLEERTAIANKSRADLFISIHANSSNIRSISGAETYYLHFARSSYEREVAARENAATPQSISELEDLIRKIVLADKSSESRELAGILQQSLYSGTRKLFPKARNRGVRRAPFVVLIGAEMPAVLVEVAFLSNPRDEKLLREENGQQVVARALLSGIEGYVKTLSNFVAQAHPGSK